MWSEWLNRALSGLPGSNDALFKGVWDKHRLLFNNMQGVGDSIDYHSARLVSATLKTSKQLLVTLPDFKPHRPAFLLATALIRHFLDSRVQEGAILPQVGPILYFGANIGIRQQLCCVSIQGLGINFAQVFSQYDIRRGASGIGEHHESAKTYLPNVITVYSPADPVEILKTSSPSWIAIDCSDAKSLLWLRPLLKEAAGSRTPVVAWGQNPLSECVTDFESLGYTFIWPSNTTPLVNAKLDMLLNSYTPIYISPMVLCGDTVDQFSASLREIRQLLIRISYYANNKGRLQKDAVAVHWKYFRSLESLSVPIDFYEAEASKFWGLHPLNKLSAACNHFREILITIDPSLMNNLETVGNLLKKTQDVLENKGCALWDSCVNLCIEGPKNNNFNLLVFPSDSRKSLFLFALLARYNTTEDDLREMMIQVTSLNDLRRLRHTAYTISDSHAYKETLYPIIVGLPSPSMTSRMFYAFLYPKLDIILYPHQCNTFMCRQTEWSARLGGNISRNTNTLANLSTFKMPKCVPTIMERILVKNPTEINIETTTKTKRPFVDSVWQPENPTAEIERLFQSDDGNDPEHLIVADITEMRKSMPANERSDEILCAAAIKVVFDQGWYAFFAPDDSINIICHRGLDSRYVSSIRTNERVLIIHGQQRQNLYDLIISRVHKDPSIELHIALIRRWQEDLRIAYKQWRKQPMNHNEQNLYGSRDIEGLLSRMKGCGSQLISSLTLT